MNKVLSKLNHGLIVSCQALVDEPLHSSFVMQKMAKAAVVGGAVGIRANSVADINAIKKEVDIPVIGIIKVDYPNSEVRITPTIAEARQLIATECEIIALDATICKRPKESLSEIVDYVRKNSAKLLMADCATIDDVRQAIDLGFDIISSTLIGYTSHSKSLSLSTNDYALLKSMLKLAKVNECYFIAEGNINGPKVAQKMLDIGCDSVVVGSAITRPQLITKKYVKAIKEWSCEE